MPPPSLNPETVLQRGTTLLRVSSASALWRVVGPAGQGCVLREGPAALSPAGSERWASRSSAQRDDPVSRGEQSNKRADTGEAQHKKRSRHGQRPPCVWEEGVEPRDLLLDEWSQQEPD